MELIEAGRGGLMHRADHTGQTTLEYAVVIVVIVAALLAMALYMKRGTMGKLRDSTDSLGGQFSPLNFKSSITVSSSGATSETSKADGEMVTTNTAESRNSRDGDEHITSRLDGETLW